MVSRYISRRTFILGTAAGLGGAIMTGCDQWAGTRELQVAVPAGPEGAAIRQLATNYRKVKTSVVDFPYETLRQKLSTSLAASHSEFDVVLLDDPWFPLLSKYLQEVQSVPTELIGDLVGTSLALCKAPYKTGTLKALPFVGNTQLLFVRRDRMPQREHLPALPSWADVVSIAKAISTDGRSAKQPFFGYAIRGRSGAPIVTDFLPLYWSLGGQITQEQGNRTVSVIDGTKLADALSLYKDLAKESPRGAGNFDWNEMTAAFEDGTAAMQLNWPIAIERLTKKLGPPGKMGKWDIMLPPGEKGGGTSMIGNWLLAIPHNTKKAADAMAFLVWLLQQQAIVAGPLTPPTRTSVFQTLATANGGEYMATIQQALAKSTPRDRTHRWSEIEDIISGGVQRTISGNQTPLVVATDVVKAMEKAFPT